MDVSFKFVDVYDNGQQWTRVYMHKCKCVHPWTMEL